MVNSLPEKIKTSRANINTGINMILQNAKFLNGIPQEADPKLTIIIDHAKEDATLFDDYKEEHPEPTV